MNTEQNNHSEKNSPASSGPGNTSNTAKKRRPRIWRFLLIILGLLVLLALAAPTLVSTRPGTNFVGRIIKAQSGQTVAMSELSLTWLGPCHVTGLRVDDEKGRKVAQVEQINVSAGLLALIKSKGQAGRLEIDSGQVYVYMPAEEKDKGKAKEKKTPKSKTPIEQVPINAVAPLNWDVAIRHTNIHLLRDDGAAYEIKNIDGDVSLKAHDSCRAMLRLELPGNAPLAVDAHVNYAIADGKLDLAHTQGSITLKTDSPIDLEKATRFFAAGPPILGQVAVDLQANFTADQIQSRLTCQLKNIQNIQNGGVAIRPVDVNIAAETTITTPRIVSQMTIDGDCGQLKVSFDWRDRDQSTPAMTGQECFDAILAGKPVELPRFSVESSGRFDLAAVARAVPSAMQLRPGLEITSGQLLINNIRLEGGASPGLVGGIELKNLAAQSSAGTTQYQPIGIDFDISTRAQQGLWIRQIKCRSDFAQIDAAGSLTAMKVNFAADLDPLRRQLNELFQLGPLDLAGRITGNLDVNRPDPQKINVVAAIKAENMKYAAPGTGGHCQASMLDYKGVLDLTNDAPARLITVTGSGSLKDFRAGDPPTGFEEKQIDFNHDVRIDQAKEKIEINKLSIRSASGILTADMTGTISQYAGPCVLDLTGRYEAGWDQLMALLKQFKPDAAETIALTGTSKSDFKISGPVRPTSSASAPTAPTAAGSSQSRQVATVLGGLTANVGVGWDKAKIYGTDLGKAGFPVSLGGAKLQVPQTNIPAAPGAANIGFMVDMNTAEPVLVIDKKLQLLEKYKVTADMAKQLLSRINPIFNDMAQADGEISLWVEAVNMPLGETMKKSGVGRGRLDLAQMRVEPAGILKQLLELGGIYDAKAGTPMVVNGCDFHMADGRIYYENFVIQFGDKFDLKFYGSVGFDETLDLTVSVPVQQPLLEKFGVGGRAGEYAKLLAGARVEIPIKGTRQKPGLNMAKVDIEPLIRKASESMLKDKAGQILNQVLTQPQPSPSQPAQTPGQTPQVKPGEQVPGQTQQAKPGEQTPSQKPRDKALDILDQVLKPKPQQDQQSQPQPQPQQPKGTPSTPKTEREPAK